MMRRTSSSRIGFWADLREPSGRYSIVRQMSSGVSLLGGQYKLQSHGGLVDLLPAERFDKAFLVL